MYNPMQPTAPRTLHPVLPVTILPVVFMLERFTYYGVRSILLLYMTNFMLIGHEEAMSIYSLFTIALFVLVLPAGIFTDLLLKPPVALIIGIAAEIGGCILLAMPSVFTMAAGIFLIASGAALFKPGIMALLGTHYIQTGRSHLLDSGFSILYAGIDIGAFLAPLVIGSLADDGDPGHLVYGFMIAGCAAIAALILLILFRKRIATPGNPINSKLSPPAHLSSLKQANNTDVLPLLGVLLLIPLFWKIYGNLNISFYSVEQSSYRSLIQTAISIIVTGGLGFLVWTYVRVDSRIKISAGLFLLLSLIVLGNVIPNEYGFVLFLFILATIAEMLVVIPASSVISMYAPPGWRATFFGVLYFIIGAFNWVTSKIYLSHNILGMSYIELISVIFCLMLAVFFLVYALVTRKRPYSS